VLAFVVDDRVVSAKWSAGTCQDITYGKMGLLEFSSAKSRQAFEINVRFCCQISFHRLYFYSEDMMIPT
jgi:hypothetical protein